MFALIIFVGLIGGLTRLARHDIRGGGLGTMGCWSRSSPCPVDGEFTRTALGVAPTVNPPSGPYEFLARQPDGSPVAYDPCRPIHYVTNTETAPKASDPLLMHAIDRISTATGLQFVNDGPTSERASATRRAFQPERYGDKWAPVLIAWTDPAAELGAGDRTGLALLGRGSCFERL